jgi:hypothetical protein
LKLQNGDMVRPRFLLSARIVSWLQFGMTAWLVLFSLELIKRSLHWPRVHDGPVIAYMVFLMDHGFTLYKNIIEVQFPGSLLVYWIQVHLFGPSEMGFRLFDLCAMGVACLAMLLANRKAGHWFAGVFSSAFLVWSHVGDRTSMVEVGQRDFFVACLMVCAAAFLIISVRQGSAGLMFWYGFCVALSASIKPTSILYLLLLSLAAIELRRRQEPLKRYAFFSIAGLIVASGIVVMFLLEEHALEAFFVLSRKILPVYTSLAQASYITMAKNLKQGAPFLVVAGWLLWRQPEIRRDWVQQVLLWSCLLGAATYFIQHKGFTYHRALFFFFVFWWAGYVFVATMKRASNYQVVAAAVLLLSCVTASPLLSRKSEYSQAVLFHLQNDLERLRVGEGNNTVQCMDTTVGCLNVLLRMKVTMSTGYVSDYYFFLPSGNTFVNEMRNDFLSQMYAKEPRVLVITNQQWPTRREDQGYEQLQTWPELQQLLKQRYRLETQMEADENGGAGYRIYVRRGAAS